MGGSRSRWRWLGGVLLFALASGQAAGEEQFNLAVAFGAGSQTSGVGMQVDGTWWPGVNGDLALTAYLGAGSLPDSTFGWLDTVRPASGVIASIGHRHRFLVDMGVGRIGFDGRTVATATWSVTVRTEWYAVSTSLGYEFMSDRGLFFRICAGAGYLLTGRAPEGWPSVSPTGNLALGIQFL